MSAARDFHIGDILSVTTGKLLSPRLIGGVYDILNFMTGQSLFTHQLPRVSREAAPVILRQHPNLAAAEVGDITADNWKDRLAELAAQFGETLPIEPMAPGEHAQKNALAELSEMVGDRPIVVVETGGA